MPWLINYGITYFFQGITGMEYDRWEYNVEKYFGIEGSLKNNKYVVQFIFEFKWRFRH